MTSPLPFLAGLAFTKSRTPSRHGYRPFPPPNTDCFGGVCGGKSGVPLHFNASCFREKARCR